MMSMTGVLLAFIVVLGAFPQIDSISGLRGLEQATLGGAYTCLFYFLFLLESITLEFVLLSTMIANINFNLAF